MTTQHTQGEWHTENYNQICDSNGNLICTTKSTDDGLGKGGIDNRPLIESAPKLLEALVTISICFGAGLKSGLFTQEMVDQALSAIAAAKGE